MKLLKLAMPVTLQLILRTAIASPPEGAPMRNGIGHRRGPLSSTVIPSELSRAASTTLTPSHVTRRSDDKEAD